MHKSSLESLSKFLLDYLSLETGLDVLDVGSYNVNGSYRDLLRHHNYTGMDIRPGPNVDIIGFDGLTGKYDLVVSGSTLEHVARPWEWIKLIASCVKGSGWVFINVPHKAGIHRYPKDYWRVLPDGMKELFRVGKIVNVEIYKTKTDTVGIGRAFNG